MPKKHDSERTEREEGKTSRKIFQDKVTPSGSLLVEEGIPAGGFPTEDLPLVYGGTKKTMREGGRGEEQSSQSAVQERQMAGCVQRLTVPPIPYLLSSQKS